MGYAMITIQRQRVFQENLVKDWSEVHDLPRRQWQLQ